MKKFIIILIISCGILSNSQIYAVTQNNINAENNSITENSEDKQKNNATYNEELNSQKQELGINDFINSSKKYIKGDFFENLNINEVLEDAISGKIDNKQIYKKILNLFGKEVKTVITSVVSILAIILIHSIMKAISENLENSNISQIIYYVQYILIVTIIMKNVSYAITIVKEATTCLVGFMNLLIPLLISLLLFTGNITTSTTLEPIILFIINMLRRNNTKFNNTNCFSCNKFMCYF